MLDRQIPFPSQKTSAAQKDEDDFMHLHGDSTTRWIYLLVVTVGDILDGLINYLMRGLRLFRKCKTFAVSD